ncbi:MAG: TlpA family protein disulfide reductase [Prevotellaceae bacterium]|jgi:thiol-disulfide isomerase/thioredoxin|nr:TlpA family protein disulfide reductase [Prevotellaceae bacterium]
MKALLKVNRMNRHILLCLFLMFAAYLPAKNRIIENPAYEFNPSGIFNVSKIELDDNETRVYIHAEFIPGWWVEFGKKGFLEDCATGKKWAIKDIRQGEFDKRISMPKSGDSTFILVYPKIDGSVKKINFFDEDENSQTWIYGISLNPKEKRRSADNPVPYGVKKWITGELAKAKRKTPMNFDAGEFFSKDTARLIGYIKGYDKRANFSGGIVYVENELTREDLPRVVRIYPDGRFDCLLPISYPQYLTVSVKNFQNHRIDFYIQPGMTLAMIIDWEEFRVADRLRNISYKFPNIQYEGALAEVNKELSAFYAKHEEPPYNQIYSEMRKKEPNEYEPLLNQLLSKYTDACRQAENDKNMSALAKSIIKNSYDIDYAGFLMSYDMYYEDRMYNANVNKNVNIDKLSNEFYGFLKNVPDNRQILSSKNFSTFINRLEYSQVFSSSRRPQSIAKNIEQYLYEELGLPKTPDDIKYFKILDSLSKQLQLDTTDAGQQKIGEKMVEENKIFTARYKDHIDDYYQKWQMEEWRIKDSIYTNALKLKLGLVSDVIKTRKLNYIFAQYTEESAKKTVAALDKLLHDKFLKQEAGRMFDKYFASGKQAASELPNTEDAAAFKKIIEPFKGKYILVDFWATWCGPCIHGIKKGKTMRESYKDSKDVAFVFITGINESPLDKYNEFVKEHGLENSYRVSELDYLSFRQLFAFNGIPHYVVVNREGRIVNGNIDVYNFEIELKTLLENEKQ